MKTTQEMKTFKIGDHYIDCGMIPRVCVGITHTHFKDKKGFLRLRQDSVTGRSLIDGVIGDCSILHCAPEKVHRTIAVRWAKTGPLNPKDKVDLEDFYAGEWGEGRQIWWKTTNEKNQMD